MKLRIDEGGVGDAVRDHVDAVVGHAMHRAEQLAAVVGHHRHAGGEVQEFVHHPPLLRGRAGKHRVERGVHRHPQLSNEIKHAFPCGAAEDAVLVLQRNDVYVRQREEFRGPAVAVGIGVGAGEPHLGRIVERPVAVIHRDHRTLGGRKVRGDGGADVAGERRQATAAGDVVTDEGDAVERRKVHWGSWHVEQACMPRRTAPSSGAGDSRQRPRRVAAKHAGAGCRGADTCECGRRSPNDLGVLRCSSAQEHIGQEPHERRERRAARGGAGIHRRHAAGERHAAGVPREPRRLRPDDERAAED